MVCFSELQRKNIERYLDSDWIVCSGFCVTVPLAPGTTECSGRANRLRVEGGRRCRSADKNKHNRDAIRISRSDHQAGRACSDKAGWMGSLGLGRVRKLSRQQRKKRLNHTSAPPPLIPRVVFGFYLMSRIHHSQSEDPGRVHSLLAAVASDCTRPTYNLEFTLRKTFNCWLILEILLFRQQAWVSGCCLQAR